MNRLIQSARIHILYTEQATGLKLKLLSALHSSGHVVVNDTMVKGTALKPFCNVVDKDSSFSKVIVEKINIPLPEKKFIERKLMLSAQFNTTKNLSVLVNVLYS